jgi:hypothetical protein
MSRRRTFSSILLAALLALASCSTVHQAMGTLRDLAKVQVELSKSLGQEQINVNLMNSRFLNVSLVNSAWKDRPPDQKHAKAIEIARLAYRSYPSQSTLTAVTVTFAIHRTYLGFFNYDDTRDRFGFEIPELTAGSSASNPTLAVH